MSRDAIVGMALIAWFVALAAAEAICARSSETAVGRNDARLLTNFTLAILILLTGTALPLGTVGASVLGEELNFGLARHIALPWAAVLILLLLSQTLASYWIHRLMHRAPLLWRAHRVHHADSAVDVSTSLRNHPLELLLTVPATAAATLLVGAPVSTVVVGQTILIAAALWQHADIRLPQRVERVVSRFMVTPRLHRLHHSRERRVHDSNYGELITAWDQLFGTLNRTDERLPVGLDGQHCDPDRFWPQIASPLHPA